MADNSTPVSVETQFGATAYENAKSFYVNENGFLVIEKGAQVIAIHRDWSSVSFTTEREDD